jgi:hypothetical protein
MDLSPRITGDSYVTKIWVFRPVAGLAFHPVERTPRKRRFADREVSYDVLGIPYHACSPTSCGIQQATFHSKQLVQSDVVRRMVEVRCISNEVKYVSG